MDIPDPISFLNRFGKKQRSVVQVMSHQSMPKNHVFHKNHKVPFSNKPFPTLFKINQNMPFSSLFFEINQIYQFQHQASSTHTWWFYHDIQNHYLIILPHFSQVAQIQTYWHIIYYSSCQFSTTPIPINHHGTQTTSYSPSTWFNPQFNHNQ